MTQLDQNTLEMGLKLLEKMPQLIENFPSLPNIKFPTMGGSFFWNDMAEFNG